MTSPLTDFLDDHEFDAKRAQSLAWQLRSGKIKLDPVEEGDLNPLSRLVYLHLCSHPELFEQARPLLDALVEQGFSPFDRFPQGQSSAYLELLASDDTQPFVQWCLDLPCAPSSLEPDRKSRIASDTLEQLLIDNPVAGSQKQLAALDLFGFDLLHTWADGQTTLDRVLTRHHHYHVEQANEPHKDFEFTYLQRGLTHLLNKVLKQDPHSLTVHDIRLYAWHQAFRAHRRLHDRGTYHDWGSEQWQAALRQFDKTLLRAHGVSGKPSHEVVEDLWQATLERASQKSSIASIDQIVAGAACYRFLDNPKAPGQTVRFLGSHQKPPPALDDDQMLLDLARFLDAAQACLPTWESQSPDDLAILAANSSEFASMARSIIDLLPHDPAPTWLVQHPALLPCLLPMMAIGSIWTSETQRLERFVIQGVHWPRKDPWITLAGKCDWAAPTRAYFDAQSLRSTSPAPTRTSTRRI